MLFRSAEFESQVTPRPTEAEAGEDWLDDVRVEKSLAFTQYLQISYAGTREVIRTGP